MDYELITWIALGIVSLIAFGLLWAKAKRDSIYYLDWVGECK